MCVMVVKQCGSHNKRYIETPARTDLLMNSDHEPQTRSVSYVVLLFYRARAASCASLPMG